MAALIHRANHEAADKALKHSEEALPLTHPQRAELSAARKRIAGIYRRLDEWLREEVRRSLGEDPKGHL